MTESGCTLHFTAFGGSGSDGKACLVSGAVPGEDGSLLTAEASTEPEEYSAVFGADAAFTSTGNTFSLVLTADVDGNAATPEAASRLVTLTLRNLPQIVFTAQE